jgi:hypothetical protein
MGISTESREETHRTSIVKIIEKTSDPTLTLTLRHTLRVTDSSSSSGPSQDSSVKKSILFHNRRLDAVDS